MKRDNLPPGRKEELIGKVLENRIDAAGLRELAGAVDEHDLSRIIQRIYDLNEQQVARIAALDAILGKVDAIKNARRNNYFTRQIQKGFRQKAGNIVILAEGDSWFNYPVLLSDVLDWVGMEPDMIVYSLAEGGDWLLNMLSARKYVEQLSVIQPDVFLISAGGNDLVGRSRLAAMIDATGGGTNEYNQNTWAKALIEIRKSKPIVDLDQSRFNNGIRYINKDFHALLMFFYLQYSFMIGGILKSGKFPDIRIITQGYDYAVPNSDKKFGPNPLRWYRPFIRMFLGHGSWLKTPLQLRGIPEKDHADIIYAMIYLFNEMMIDVGNEFCTESDKRVFHIDSRGSVGDSGWSDELHPLPIHFHRTGQTFIDCIRQKPNNGSQVYVVQKLHP
ncbi:hypothetical protein [Chitinophaga sp.]|uniref:hypothetical protein n=1 Tax=Chitinophaga sp. TaxID=1869181 RepID=UPI0031E0B0F6